MPDSIKFSKNWAELLDSLPTPIQSDITKLNINAIVNAANHSLLGGGGVDGAIHDAAGPGLLEECKKLNGCKTGEAKITEGYNLPAKYVIHTVGPVYGRENGREAELLADCYRNSLNLAKEYGIKTIAFSCISTGAFGYPKQEAAKIAIETTKQFIQSNPGAFHEIFFICFLDRDLEVYKGAIRLQMASDSEDRKL